LTPLPAALGSSSFVAWRLEREKYLSTWDAAEGAFQVGGRWSSKGRRVIYASLDPATTILEVAVHKGFDVLDTVPHRLLEVEIDAAPVYVVQKSAIPNPNWLQSGTVSPNQQAFGDALLSEHPLVLIPSVVSGHSWNLLIDTATATGTFRLRNDERFALDTRLLTGLHR
jgi:RES domain-containing protein